MAANQDLLRATSSSPLKGSSVIKSIYSYEAVPIFLLYFLYLCITPSIMIDSGKNTNRAIVEKYLHIVNDLTGFNSDDLTWSKYAIFCELQKKRAVELKRYIKKQAYDLNDAFQILPCVDLIEVDRHECPCVPETG